MIELLMAAMMVTGGASPADTDSLYQKEIFVSGQDTLQYRIMLPPDFREDRAYPFILFLHGSGERGNDNTKQLVHGAEFFGLDSNSLNFPAIVVFPQCPEMETWARVKGRNNEAGERVFDFNVKGPPTATMQLLLEWLDGWIQQAFIDPERLYLGGLSMGGMGTFELLSLRPRTFAAAFPICGGGNPRAARKYARYTACWIFHGALDKVVPPVYSETMVKAIRKRKGEVRFTLFPGVEHNSWDPAFKEPDLLLWLFSKKLVQN